jgi:hypothetical protein
MHDELQVVEDVVSLPRSDVLASKGEGFDMGVVTSHIDKPQSDETCTVLGQGGCS